jgi:hypothetical protein
MLRRFAPWDGREPEFDVAAPASGPALPRLLLAARAALIGLATGLGSLVLLGSLAAVKDARAGRAFELLPRTLALLAPRTPGEWTTLAGIVVGAGLAALGTAAALAVRHATADE